jgi:glycosyltransferase involved in cell wall biosynthesis
VFRNDLALGSVNSPLVSICTPTYNRPGYLRQVVASCQAQTYPHFELIITDNSTNNESADLASQWTDPRVRYYRNDGNIGPTESVLRGLSLAKGKYIKILMDDDLIKPRSLELMVKALEENPSVAIAMAPMDLIDENDRRIFPRFYVFRTMHYRFRYQVGDGLIDRRRILKDFLTRDYPCTVPSGIIYRAEPLRRLIPLPAEAEFAADLELCMQLAAQWDFFYIDQVLSTWRYMPANHTASQHQTGINIRVFYGITRRCLAHPAVKEMFRDEWAKIVRDSIFFCSCRALLNALAGIRSCKPSLIFGTIKTILREDRDVINWLRLPLFVVTQIWISLFPVKLPPPRE